MLKRVFWAALAVFTVSAAVALVLLFAPQEISVKKAIASTPETHSETVPTTEPPTTTQPVEPEETIHVFTMEEADKLASQDAETLSKDEAFDVRFRKLCRFYNVPGGQLVVFNGGKPVFSAVYGLSDREKKIKVRPQTKFRVASISKFVTGIMAMKLDSLGILDIDRDISDYLGVKVRHPSCKSEIITTKHLMSHNSGICDGDGVFGTIPLSTILSHFSRYSMGTRPGEKYEYSNLAASFVSAVIEGAAHKHFADFSRKDFFEPLGLDAAFFPDQIEDADLISKSYRGKSVAYDPRHGQITTKDCYNTPLGEFISACFGDLLISATDLAKLAASLATDGAINGRVLLPKESIDEMCTVQVAPRGVALKVVPDELAKGRTLYGHNGASYGVISSIYFDRTDGSGFVFLNNGCSQKTGNYTYVITENVARMVYEDYLA